MRLMITGKMGSGKGFAATRFVHKYGATRWTRTDLMKRLSHGIVDQTDMPDEILGRIFDDPDQREMVAHRLLEYAASYEPEPGKPRRMYQDITQICQEADPLCFEEELADRIEMSQSSFTLIDDVRSLAAFEFFSELGYLSLRINADEEVRKRRMLERDGYLPFAAAFDHPSETELDDIEHDFAFDNNGDHLEEFYRAVDEAYRHLKEVNV